jgi:hypothetical protein
VSFTRAAAALLPLACAVVVGCSPPPCRTGPAPALGNDAGALLDQPTLTVAVAVPRSLTCQGSTAPPEVITSEVHDPENLPLASTAVFDGNVQVSFASRGPGWYHLKVTLDGERQTQTDVMVLPDATATSPHVDLPSCAGPVQQLSTGSYLCDRRVVRSDAGISPELQGNVLAAEDTLWLFGASSELRRMKDDGQALVPASSPGASNPIYIDVDAGVDGRLSSALATATELIVVRRTSPSGVSAQRYSAQADGGLVAEAEVTKDTSALGTGKSTVPVTLVSVRSGSSVFALVHGCVDLTCHLLSCTFTVTAQGLEAVTTPCDELKGIPLGVSQGGVWALDDLTLRFYGPSSDNRRLESKALVSVPSHLVFVPELTAAPLGGRSPQFNFKTPISHVVIPRLLQERISFHAYQTATDTHANVGAKEDLLWTRRGVAAGTRVYTLP